MKIKNIFLLLFLFSIGFSSIINSENLKEYTIIVNTDKNEIISNAIVQIGDLTLTTDNNGKSSVMLFPAIYDITVSKNDYYSFSESIDFNNKDSIIINLVNKFYYKTIKTIDKDNNFIKSNLKVLNLDSGKTVSELELLKETDIKFEKNIKYILEINTPIYKKETVTLEYNQNDSSQNLDILLEKKETIFNFSFNTQNGNIKIYDKNKKIIIDDSFSNSSYTLKLPYDEYFLEISADKYISAIQNISADNIIKNINIVLKNKYKNIRLNFEIGLISDILFLDKYSDYEIKENKTIIYFEIKKGNLLVTSGSSFSFVDLELEEGLYDLYVSNELAYPFTKKDFKIFSEQKENIIIKLRELPVFIEGKINITTGSSVTIYFKSDNNKTYSTNTTTSGSFNLFLPVGSYTLAIDNKLFLLKKENTSFNFDVPGNKLFLNLEIEELPEFISGYVKDFKGNPLKDALITIKVNKDEKSVYTDKNGFYSTNIKNGLAIIKASKDGFKSKGNVKKINKSEELNSVNFFLEEIYGMLSGTITDGVSPLLNINLKLFDLENIFIAETKTNIDGFFNFNNLSISKKYKIKIENEFFYNYTSPEIEIFDSKTEIFNIILNKNTLNAIIEIKSENLEPIQDLEVIINNIKYITDMNGLIESNIFIENNSYKFNLFIEQFNYRESFDIPLDQAQPLKHSIVLKAY